MNRRNGTVRIGEQCHQEWMKQKNLKERFQTKKDGPATTISNHHSRCDNNEEEEEVESTGSFGTE